MVKLFKMDLYRMLKAKSFYICLVLTFALALFDAPLEKIMYSLANSLSSDINEQFNTVKNLSEIFSNPFPMLGAMIIMLSLCFFFYADVENGYIKNIAGQMPMKGFTILSKFQVSSVHNIIFALAGIIGNMIGNLLVRRIVADDAVLDSLRILVLRLLLLQSICAILLMVVSTFRNKALGMILAVIFGIGINALLTYPAINSGLSQLFGEGTTITPYMPDAVMGETNPDTIRAILVAVIAGGIFLILAIRLFDRKDVK